ncbi:TonB-dependent copper receptor [Pseudohaliea rubra]|nr:TonB-dependent copper receptor [Pseudohaliea rubra]
MRPPPPFSRSILVSCLAAVLSTPLALAAEKTPGDELPNIIVIGVRESSLGEDVLNLDRENGAPAADGAELLRSVNGLSLGRFGGRGLEPTLRGQSQGRINVLLDGAYLHGGCPNRMDPPTSFASVNTFERITVLKGVQTLRYGGGGSGGTLLFERENEPDRDGFSGGLRAGTTSNGLERDIAAELAWAGKPGYLRLNIEDRSADNYRDGGGDAVRSAYAEDSVYLAGGLRLRDRDRLELAVERTETTDALFPGAGMDAPEDTSDQYRLRYRGYNLAGLDELSVELYRTEVGHLMDNYSNRPLTAPMALRVPSRSDTTGARIIGEFTTGEAFAWTLGLDYQRNERSATRYLGPTTDNVQMIQSFLWPDASLEQAGAFAELRWSVAADRSLKAGLRYDRVSAEADATGAKPASPMLPGPDALYEQYYGVTHADQINEDNWGGLLRYEQQLGNRWTAFAGISRTVRTADASERFLAAANTAPMMRWIGNPGLNPETHRQADAGLVLLAGKHRIDGVAFYDSVSDYILRDRAHGQGDVLPDDNATVYRNVDARLHGVEGSWTWRVGGGWEASASLAWVRAENTSENRDIAQTPPLNGSLNLDYDTSRWRAGASLRWAAEQDRVEANPMVNSGLDAGETPDWAVLDLYASMSLGSFGDLRAGVDNLFDRRYAEHLNRSNLDPFNPVAIRVNEPGRVLWARYEYRF